MQVNKAYNFLLSLSLYIYISYIYIIHYLHTCIRTYIRTYHKYIRVCVYTHTLISRECRRARIVQRDGRVD